MRRLSLNKKKRAQNISLTTILLMVLGVVVVVLLIWGFSTGWSNMWDKITNFVGGGSNVEAVKSGCELACTTENKQVWCEEVRTLKKSDGTRLKGSCENFAKSNDLDVSCDVNCGDDVYKQTCGDLWGEWKDGCGDKTDLTSKVKDTTGKDKDNCCKKS